MNITVKILSVALLLAGILLCSCDKENESPEVEVLKPVDGTYFMQGDLVDIKIKAEDSDGKIESVKYYLGGILMDEDTEAPWESAWTQTDTASIGKYRFYAIAYDDEGDATSAGVDIIINIPSGFNPDLTFGSVMDVDRNVYKTIEIGEQTWMAENLNVTHYADGSSIPLVEDSADWKALDIDEAAYCWFNNEASEGEEYGAFYSWAAAYGSDLAAIEPVQGVCPDGWHLPSEQEWKQLEMYLGMSASEVEKDSWRGEGVGSMLKEKGYSQWKYPNGGTDATGFRALPAGFRNANGGFYGYFGSFWTSTEDSDTTMAWIRSFLYDEEGVSRVIDLKNSGYSVRCVMD